jgi:hypothetical protein
MNKNLVTVLKMGGNCTSFFPLYTELRMVVREGYDCGESAVCHKIISSSEIKYTDKC